MTRNYTDSSKLSAFALWVMAIADPACEGYTPAMRKIVEAVRSDFIQPFHLFDLMSLRDHLEIRGDIDHDWDELQAGANDLWDTFAAYMEMDHGCEPSTHEDFKGSACVPREYGQNDWDDPRRNPRLSINEAA